MSKKACHCKKSEECEECPEWIFTFADLVMLMMGFFVILWVLKPSADPKTDPIRAAEEMESYYGTIGDLRGGFGWEPNPAKSDPVDQAVIRIRARNGPGEKGKLNRPVRGAEGTESQVMSIRPGQHASVGGKINFDKGDAHLTPETEHILDQIAQTIRGHRNIVDIKGHTSRDDFPDDVPAEKQMDLSIRRALAVHEYLVHAGVQPEILRVEGSSVWETVAQRAYTPESQSNNRRVEVEASSTLVDELQASAPATQTSASQPAAHPDPH